MTEQQMKDATRRILGAIGANPSLQDTLTTKKGYIYSAYVSTLIAEVLSQEPSVFVLVNNPLGGPFRFPMGRSEIYSGIASWYEIRTPERIWEMHLCCECEGVSRLAHELDVLIVSQDVAHDCRTRRRRPAREEVLFLVECKNVGTIEYGSGREFVGLCFEFPFRGEQSKWEWRGYKHLGAFVATLSSLPSMPSALQLVAARELIAHSYVEPSDPSKVRKFQKQVMDALRPVIL